MFCFLLFGRVRLFRFEVFCWCFNPFPNVCFSEFYLISVIVLIRLVCVCFRLCFGVRLILVSFLFFRCSCFLLFLVFCLFQLDDCLCFCLCFVLFLFRFSLFVLLWVCFVCFVRCFFLVSFCVLFLFVFLLFRFIIFAAFFDSLLFYDFCGLVEFGMLY